MLLYDYKTLIQNINTSNYRHFNESDYDFSLFTHRVSVDSHGM